MTRRCSVMRMPVAAQRASMPVAFSAGVDFSAVMGFAWSNEPCCATAGGLRQVAAHYKRIQLYPVCLPVIAFAASGDTKSGPFVKPPRRLIIFLDLEEHGPHAAARELAEMRQEQVAGEPASPMPGGNADRGDLGLAAGHARY